MVDSKCPIGIETTISVKMLATIAGIFLTVCAMTIAALGWFVDTKIESSTAQILTVVTEQNVLIDRRISTLENNVSDRWTATNMYQFAMEFYEALRDAGIDIEGVDPYDVKRRSAAR